MTHWDRNLTRRTLIRRTGQFAAAAGAASVVARTPLFSAEARAEILATANSMQNRAVTIKAVQPIAPAADEGSGIALQEVYNRFMLANPDVSVEFAYIPWADYTQALSVAIGGGNAPDVATWIDDQRIPQLAANGFLRSVDELAQADGIDLTEIDPVALSSNTYNGKLFGLPYYWDDRILYYNTDYFSEAGIAAPPETWDDAVRMGAELDRKDGDTYSRIGYIPLSPSTLPGFGAGGNSFLFLYGWQNGGEFVSADGTKVTVNDPAIVEALEWAVQVSDSYGGAEEQANFIQQAARGNSPFVVGAAAMITNVTGFGVRSIDAAEEPVKWGAAKAPFSTTPATWSGVLSAALPVGTKHEAESWELAKFMMSPETQLYLAETLRWIPTRTSLWPSISLFTTDPEITVGLEAFPTTRIRPPVPNSQQLWDELLRASDNALYHQMSAKEALDDANAKIQAGLDEYLKKS